VESSGANNILSREPSAEIDNPSKSNSSIFIQLIIFKVHTVVNVTQSSVASSIITDQLTFVSHVKSSEETTCGV